MADQEEVQNTRIADDSRSGKSDTEAVPAPPDVVELCKETFKRTAEYLRGEFEGTVDDYKLLETMNKITIAKYSEMKQIAGNVANSLQDLNEKYKSMQPFLDQIDQIEDNISTLEQAAYRLDAYSKRLEAKFKSLEKRSG
ncbi:hypothetical protein CHS0354_033227 [Potamilus streckersoni]|uniref:Biogenesis of lysosome-related organelles complex 1 subunit 2 n=1 Tax=Potamilus streckersoni TaxID=2493646 RepID=A0AAE0S6H9_9BIVA|nr:hypothetical protein CHS0354_033227 [Potamilus streckersoni]